MTRGCATLLRRALLATCAAAALAGCSREPSPEAQWALVEQYCVECHNETDLAGDIAFDKLGPDDVAAHADTFERAVRKLRGRMMPPPGGTRPDNAAVDSFVAWLEATLDAAEPRPAPGYVTPHRMNRAESADAVRDLLALEVDPATLLPVDGAQHAYDNIANALTVSPSFIDQFLSAARNLSAQAVGNAHPRAVGVPYTIGNARAQQFHVDGLPLGTRGGGVIEHYFPADGEYKLNIGNLVTGLWGFNQEHKATVVALLDGRRRDQRAPEKHSVHRDRGRAPPRRDVPAPLVRGIGSAALLASAGRRAGLGADPEPARDLRARDRHGTLEHTEPRQDFRLPARGACRRKRVCEPDRRRVGAASVPRRVHGRRLTEAHAPLRRGSGERRLRARRRARARGRACAPEVPVSLRAEAAGRGAGRLVSALQRRARVAALLLYMELDPRRRAAGARCRRPARRTRRAAAASRAHAGRSARRDSRVELRVPVARLGRARRFGSGPIPVRRRRPRHSQALRDRVAALRRQRFPLGRERARLADRELHVRQRNAGASLRHRRRLRHALPPRRAHGREPLRLTRQGRRAARLVVSESHVARAARPVAAREYPWGPAARAAAERRGARRDRRRAEGDDGARAAR